MSATPVAAPVRPPKAWQYIALSLMALLILAFTGQNVSVTTGAGGVYYGHSRLARHAVALFDAEGKLAFDFKTYVEAGKDDPDRQVMVIDYADIESNPRLVIRSIRDELVDIAAGVYLGKILFRLPGDKFTKIGYFALRSDR